MKELFISSWDESDPYWIIKIYFNIMYADGYFIEALTLLTSRNGLSTDGAYCHFLHHDLPDSRDVEFAFGYPSTEGNELVVDESVCFKYARMACELYLRKHPEDINSISDIINKLPA